MKRRRQRLQDDPAWLARVRHLRAAGLSYPDIAAAVREGAMAYLRRQYRVVSIVFVALVVLRGLLWALHLQPALSMLGVPGAGLLSGLCGWFGMRMATNASARTTNAAKRCGQAGSGCRA